MITPTVILNFFVSVPRNWNKDTTKSVRDSSRFTWIVAIVAVAAAAVAVVVVVVGLILLWNLVSTPSEEITQIDSK
jgi:anti-sigma-K factor RskA